VFERGQLVAGLVVFGLQVRPLRLGHVVNEGRIAKEEHPVGVHLRVAQHAVDDLQLGDALARLVLHPPVLAGRLVAERLGHPAIALAQDAHEEGAAVVDLLEAQVEHPVLLGLLFGDAPTQVDIHEVDAVLFQPLP